MKLAVIIPCFNEEKTLPIVLNSIPQKIAGITKIETIIVDDGSTDKTVAIAQKLGVSHIIIHKTNKGLARSFADGIDAALATDAHIIVNTDGDNQYPQSDIPRLITPILEGRADMVIANRQTDQIKHFSLPKKILQKLGSAIVRFFSGTEVADAVSGFRAYSREAALNLNLFTNYTYTIESIIQMGKKHIKIASVPVTTNAKTRESRLITNMASYLKRSLSTILRLFTIYEPLKVFLILGAIITLPGIAAVIRFFYFVFNGSGAGHIQSLIIGAVLMMIGAQTVIMGIVADLIGVNRKLSEEILYRFKKLQHKFYIQDTPVLSVRMKRGKRKESFQLPTSTIHYYDYDYRGSVI